MFGKTHTKESTQKRLETVKNKYGKMQNQFSKGKSGKRANGNQILVFDNHGNFIHEFDYCADCFRHYESLGVPYSTPRNAYQGEYSIKPFSKNFPKKLQTKEYEKHIGWWFVRKDNTEVIERIKNLLTP